MRNFRLAMVVVHYETPRLMERLLEGLEGGSLPEVLVVVDHSPVNRVKLLIERAEFPIHYFHDAGNPGFGAGLNRGVAAVPGYAYYLLANCDIRIKPKVIEGLLTFAENHEGVGIVGPRIRTPEGWIEPSWGRHVNIFGEALERFRHTHAYHHRVQRQEEKRRAPRRVPWVTGACMLVRGETWKAIKGFDERFFLYYEDCDFCLRAEKHGWETWYVPEYEVEHERGASTREAGYHKVMLQRRLSQWYYYRKHRPVWERGLLALYFRLRGIPSPTVQGAITGRPNEGL